MKLPLIIITLLFTLSSAKEVSDEIGTCDSPKSSCGADPSRPKSDVPPKHFNIILIGATGDLASKYLWRSLFEVFRARFDKSSVRFQIYGSARKDTDEGRKFVSRLLLNLISCDKEDEVCREAKKDFVEAVQYNRLKTERDFKDLGDKMHENTQSMYGLSGSPVTYEVGRLVYMSIPPSTYTKTAKFVHTYLRPRTVHPWFRVVLEKPFGHDLESAMELSSKLNQYFKENEIYRVDHYLGKTVVKQILPFRYRNRATYEPLWNKDHIEQVDIVMKEKDDVAGRIAFYNEVGIIRDVVQNHLTEMFAIVAMELPENSGNISAILESKVKVLQQVRSLGPSSSLTAQYSTYNSEWMANEQKNFSKIATFAANALFINNDRWKGVPFILMSGKKLEEKSSYVRIKFRNAQHCMRQTDEACHWQKQIVFNIGGSNLRFPAMISTSRGLPAPQFGGGWVELPAKKEGKSNPSTVLFGQSLSEMTTYVPDVEKDPYTELINAVMDGERTAFTPTDVLLASWKIWTPVIHRIDQLMPRQYVGRGKDSEKLDFLVTRSGIRWLFDDHHKVSYESPAGEETVRNVPDMYRNSPLVSGTADATVQKLANSIAEEIQKYQAEGVDFHLALSGGRGGAAIFESLTESVESWVNVHLWLVDERCVSPADERSNFNLLQHHLLNKITSIPHWHIHPMPVSLGKSLCDDTDQSLDGAKLYEDAIRQYIPDLRWDFVVLGMGEDGHTASLFPGWSPVEDNRKLVVYSKANVEGENTVVNRMSLTRSSINSSKHIAVLVLGASKRDIVKSIETSEDTVTFPILGVKPSEDAELTWYIDYDALLG